MLRIIACDLVRTTREGLIEIVYTANNTNLDPKPHSYGQQQAEGIPVHTPDPYCASVPKFDSQREEAQ